MMKIIYIIYLWNEHFLVLTNLYILIFSACSVLCSGELMLIQFFQLIFIPKEFRGRHTKKIYFECWAIQIVKRCNAKQCPKSGFWNNRDETNWHKIICIKFQIEIFQFFIALNWMRFCENVNRNINITTW